MKELNERGNKEINTNQEEEKRSLNQIGLGGRNTRRENILHAGNYERARRITKTSCEKEKL